MLYYGSHVAVIYIGYSNTARVCWLLIGEKNQVILEKQIKNT